MRNPYLALAIALLAVAGCSKPEAPQGQLQQNTQQDENDHTHEAPHGGALVELGDHAGHVELLLDSAEGRLTLYALDAHAENPVRSDMSAILVTIEPPDGAAFDVTLSPRENTLTGETTGDTSEFTGMHETLKGMSKFGVNIGLLDLRGLNFRNISFNYPEGAQTTGDTDTNATAGN